MAREDFKQKIKEKFDESVGNAEVLSIPAMMEQHGTSPSAFGKDHFHYGNDRLNYFKLYQELMFNHDRMVLTVNAVSEKRNGDLVGITFDDMESEAFVSRAFFKIFPEKLTSFRKLLVEEMKKG
jgi:hypothetical protein